MSQVTEVRDVAIGNWLLSVTARDAGDDPKLLEELTYRTILMWINIVRRLEQQNYAYDGGSVEQTLAAEIPTVDEHPFEFQPPWGDGSSRVTVWSTFRGSENPNFHLNSDDTPQVAIDVWRANQLGSERAIAKFNSLLPNASNSTSKPISNVSTPPQATTTPKAPENVQNVTLYTKKDAIAKLPPGSPFKWRVAQIEKHSKDGKDFYEFFEFWGGKAGQYSGASVFTDNEIAINSGLIAYLDSLGIKAGQALSGNWITNATVGKPKTKTVKGEEKTFTNIYVNSFEGQPEKV